MRLLIVGAGGMLGTDLVAEAERQDVATEAVSGRAALDITDLDAVRACVQAVRPDVVVNCAAWTNVDGAEADPDGAWRLNALGAAHLAAACSESLSWLIQISTDFVFDGEKGSPYHEFDSVNPVSVYGASKEAGERLVRQLLPDRHMIARTAFLYGKSGPNLVETILRAAKSRPSLTFVEDQVVSPTSTAALAVSVLHLAKRPLAGTYHTACEGACSLQAFAQQVVDLAGIPTPVLPIRYADYVATYQPPARRPRHSPLEGRLLRLRGLPPLPPWQDALKTYLGASR